MLDDSALTIGLDVGDRFSSVCVLDSASGEVLEESRVRTRPEAIERFFTRQPSCRVAMEVGTHSPWLSRAVRAAGHDAIVANAYQVRLVYGARRKNDRIDAEKLARLARFDVKLLKPVQHRSSEAHADLARLKARDALVRARASLVLHVRGIVKTTGSRLPSGSVDAFHQRARAYLPSELTPALAPVLDTLEHLTNTIKRIEKELAAVAKRDYPETRLLQQVPGVGPLTSLAFILTLEDPTRFARSREVGPYLGLTPGQRQSGDRDVATGITKQGDAYLRRLLVQCAQHILHKGADSDLKRAGERLKERGAHPNKAVTAIARKLAVLLHHLWISGEVYEPLHNHSSDEGHAIAA